MTCDSCGADEPRLLPVRRVYLATGEGGVAQVQPDVEEWCMACLSQYPHEPVGP
jgi:hypothetical protein